MSVSSQKTVNKWLITITVMLPAIMEIIDTSVANVALPHMQGSLNAGTDEITWVLTSYLVSNAVVLPMTGWLARMFGRKRFLITCIILFTLSSLLCGAAPTLATLILFRIIQGATGGALQPLSQAVMLEAFPPQDRGKAMGFWGLGIVVAPMLGPVLGGLLTCWSGTSRRPRRTAGGSPISRMCLRPAGLLTRRIEVLTACSLPGPGPSGYLRGHPVKYRSQAVF